MKKNCFYLLIIVLSTNLSSYSQDYRYGIKGGINYCGLNGPNVPLTYDKQYGFSGGFYIDSRVAEYMSTQVELNFTRYKFNFTEPIHLLENSILKIEEKNSFLTVPVLLKYKRGYEFIFLYVNAGLQLSILLDNNRTSSLTLNNLLVDSDYYYDYKHNWYDYGLVGGAGVQIKALNIDIRYYFSTRNMYTSEDAREMRYNIISLDMAYQFNYKDTYFYGRKTGMKGLMYKIKHLFK